MIDLRQGNCLDVLKAMPDNCIDSIVTDPPYGLSFMGKKWDYDVPSTEIWAECLRVLKPGGHLLSFFGTRTYHRGVVRIEDAGFEIRDQIQWLYGSGFPKSMDISKAIDKQAGAEREVVGHAKISGSSSRAYQSENKTTAGKHYETAPATDLAKKWQGWGTALKPANEPIVLARKPIDKGLTIADNVVRYGTGGINIDESRIGESLGYFYKNGPGGNSFSVGKGIDGTIIKPVRSTKGRWPANLILDEDAAQMLDEQSGIEASRFFYVAKASKSERNKGLEGMPTIQNSNGDKWSDVDRRENKKPTLRQNHHPTVKPIKLMEYLIKLITPPNGTVLDPFMGSGSTGVAANRLGFSFAGIELDGEYFEIAKKRIEQNDRENIS